MSGFSADWLALREPADHAARSPHVLAAVVNAFTGAGHMSIVDLGCGTGSNLRGTALALPALHQSWTLVDHDPALLEAARAALLAWADEGNERGEELHLRKGDREILVDTRVADLASDLDRVLDWQPDLITAAALFDLVSADWIARFAASCARRRLSFYTVLTYDGREIWEPAHPLDAAVNAAFHADQTRDKGFGPAAGPGAARALREAFAAQGYRLTTGDSPWRLAPDQADLIAELADGIAAAARATGQVTADQAAQWRKAHDRTASVLIGHEDVFARSS
jgi:SAM-dependent methyltransferase